MQLGDALLEVSDRALELQDHERNPSNLKVTFEREPVHDSIDHPVIPLELGRLETLGQPLARRLLDDPRTREPDPGPGSAMITSAAVANEAVTPNVGSVRTET